VNIKERKGKQRPMEDMPEVVDGLTLDIGLHSTREQEEILMVLEVLVDRDGIREGKYWSITGIFFCL